MPIPTTSQKAQCLNPDLGINVCCGSYSNLEQIFWSVYPSYVKDDYSTHNQPIILVLDLFYLEILLVNKNKEGGKIILMGHR